MFYLFDPQQPLHAASAFPGRPDDPGSTAAEPAAEPAAEALHSFVVIEDPGPYPLASGAELTLLELHYGLRYQTFNLGVRLYDRETGLHHVVCLHKKGQALEPPSRRLAELREQRDPARGEKA